MRLKGNLFDIIDEDIENLKFTIKLNKEDIVYKGHFPGFPVTPGVTQLQIVQELLEYTFNSEVNLLSISKCNFLKVIDPNKVSLLDFEFYIQKLENGIKIKAISKSEKDMLNHIQDISNLKLSILSSNVVRKYEIFFCSEYFGNANFKFLSTPPESS